MRPENVFLLLLITRYDTSMTVRELLNFLLAFIMFHSVYQAINLHMIQLIFGYPSHFISVVCKDKCIDPVTSMAV